MKKQAIYYGINNKIDDPLDIENASNRNNIWIGYPDIKPETYFKFVCANGATIYYISFSMAIRFLQNPWDDRTIYLKFHNNWLDDERLSNIRETKQRKYELVKHFWDRAKPSELFNDKST